MIAYYILLSVCVSSPRTKLDQRGAKYHFFPLLLRLDGDVSGLLIVALGFLFRAPGQTQPIAVSQNAEAHFVTCVRAAGLGRYVPTKCP